MSNESRKISFADLDGFLKFAPIIGIGILAYLQTLFPSKIEFEKLEDHLIQMDKKITEITILQKDTSDNAFAIRDLSARLRQIEINLAKHSAEDNK
jgi:hypothetical protein